MPKQISLLLPYLRRIVPSSLTLDLPFSGNFPFFIMPYCPPYAQMHKQSAFSALQTSSCAQDEPSPSTASPCAQYAVRAIAPTARGTNCEDIPKSYRRRNVCKSVLRRICQSVKSDKEIILKALREARYREEAIEKGYHEVLAFFDTEKQREVSERAHLVLEAILKKKTVHTFILRDMLSKMLEEWKSGENGKIAGKNLEIYKNVCTYYYERALQITQC
eukprot:TRINITY_DN6040_c0_g1_i6.p1 TRINITY_DN6040_c0_g1~~TRINITY_DN6040_c0_g1_i6.p1  ORF type:complete len:219 (+),score=5.42 TRINITY_DN6040_c0_g1_i6:589-1245(+)